MYVIICFIAIAARGARGIRARPARYRKIYRGVRVNREYLVSILQR